MTGSQIVLHQARLVVKRLKTGGGFGGEEVHEDFERSWGGEESYLSLSIPDRQTEVDS